MNFRQIVRRAGRGGAVEHLEQRVSDLEQAVTELRRHHLRLAELADVVQELLVPMASRDEKRIREALDKFAGGI